MSHQYRYLQHRRPQTAAILKPFHIESVGVLIVETAEVCRSQVTCRVVQEHVFGAGVGGPDAATFGAGMPLIDGGVVLGTRVRTTPCCVRNLVPDFFGGNALHYSFIAAGGQFPVLALGQLVKKIICHTDGIVGVLPRHSTIGFSFIVTGVARCNKGPHFLFLLHFPVDELHDLRMIQIETDHLGSSACGATRLDRTRRPVTYLEEAHQTAGSPPTAELLVFSSNGREIGAYSRSVFKDPGFPDPEVHDTAVIDKVVLHAEDEAGMRLWPFIGRSGFLQLAISRINEIMSLRLARNTIGLMEAGIEPLRGIGYTGLVQDTIDQLFVKHLRIIGAGKITITLTPYPPAIGHTMRHLLHRGLPSQ